MKNNPLILAAGCLVAFSAQAAQPTFSDKLLLTGGVTNIEGAAGGGLTPWAVIGGYGTKGQVGGSANYTRVNLRDYALDTYGALIGIDNRVEFSVARQSFNLEQPGVAVRGVLGQTQTGDYKLGQDIYGVKVRVAGDAVLDQDTWMPQIAVGALVKRSHSGYGAVPSLGKALGARSDNGVDYYVAATKLFLNQSLLLNTTVRATKANQFGLLGFGGADDNRYRPQFEASAAYLLRKNLAVGAEYRSKPDNIKNALGPGTLRETNAYDVFLAWAVSKNATATLAYVDVGKIAPVVSNNHDQRGTYLSIQLGF